MKLKIKEINSWNVNDILMPYEFIYQLSINNVSDIRNCARLVLVKYFDLENPDFVDQTNIPVVFDYVSSIKRVSSDEHIFRTANEEEFNYDEMWYENDVIRMFLYKVWQYKVTNISESAKHLYKLIVYTMDDYDEETINTINEESNESVRQKFNYHKS